MSILGIVALIYACNTYYVLHCYVNDVYVDSLRNFHCVPVFSSKRLNWTNLLPVSVSNCLASFLKVCFLGYNFSFPVFVWLARLAVCFQTLLHYRSYGGLVV